MFEYSPNPVTLVSLLPEQYHGDISDQLLVSDVQTDSREVTPGALFIALAGSASNGEKYISHAVENGAVAILVEDGHLTSMLNVEVPIIGVENLKIQVPDIAEKFFGAPSKSLQVLGVTGTNGKSTIVSLLAQISALMGKKSATVGTLGYGFSGQEVIETGMTTPDVVNCHRILAELKNERANIVAMEVSSHGIDQGRIAKVEFAVGVISNVTRDHLDYHGTLENYAETKRSFLLSSNCAAAVVNLDDALCAQVVEGLEEQGKAFLTYGIDNDKADIRAEIIAYTDAGIKARIKSRWGESETISPFVGAFNLSNVLAVISAGCLMGYGFSELLKLVPKLVSVNGRMQKVDVEAAVLPNVYVDYAHTPDALEKVLSSIKPHVIGKLWVVFGCGGDRDKGKRAEMAKIAEKLADRVIVTSDNPRGENPQAIIQDIELGFGKAAIYESIEDRKLAIAMAIGSCDPHDCVIVAGKGHEDYQLIKGKKFTFSDYLVAKEALEVRERAGGGR